MLYTWHKADELTLDKLEENRLTEIAVAGKAIGLLKRGSSLLAFSAVCPHAGANLCEGWIDARGHIACPLHGYRYDPANGRNTTGEGYKLKTYPVEIREDFIYIGII
jgi:nitrite reductase/ring-hydroxylating ferredoxin subunit